MSNYLGDYLRRCRGEHSLREFAAKCRISHTHLDSIEKGADPRTGKKVSISTDTLRLIADGIGVDFIFLACLADGWSPDMVSNAVVPSGYRTEVPFQKPLNQNETRLLDLYRDLNEEGQERLMESADDMVRSGKYIKSDQSGVVQKKA